MTVVAIWKKAINLLCCSCGANSSNNKWKCKSVTAVISSKLIRQCLYGKLLKNNRLQECHSQFIEHWHMLLAKMADDRLPMVIPWWTLPASNRGCMWKKKVSIEKRSHKRLIDCLQKIKLMEAANRKEVKMITSARVYSTQWTMNQRMALYRH